MAWCYDCPNLRNPQGTTSRAKCCNDEWRLVAENTCEAMDSSDTRWYGANTFEPPRLNRHERRKQAAQERRHA